MSELTDAIDAFLEKHPDDAVLEWKSTRPKKSVLDVMMTDLIVASERHRKSHTPDAAA